MNFQSSTVTSMTASGSGLDLPLLDRTKPTRKSLVPMFKKCKSFARSTHSNHDLTNGFLSSITTPAQYDTETNGHAVPVPFNPAHPGPGAFNIEGPAAQYNRHRDEHKELLERFTQHKALHNYVKHEIRKAIHPMFLAGLAVGGDTELANTTVPEIFTYLFLHYGKITADDLTQNEKEMEAPWSPSTPIQSLFAQVQKGVDYAAEEEPIPLAKQIRTCLNLFQETKLFKTALETWHAKPANEKTMTNLIIDFSLFYENNTATMMTSSMAGYQSANAATAIIPGTLEAFLTGTGQHYCWTHSVCTHHGRDCVSKAPGHQDSASIRDMQGGNNFFRFPRAEGETPLYRHVYQRR